MSKAAWEGSKLCYFQTSLESPALFVLLQLIFSPSLQDLKLRSLKNGITETEWLQLLAYSSAVFHHCGNYQQFRQIKFVPELSQESFLLIVRSSSSYNLYHDVIDNILDRIIKDIYSHERCVYGLEGDMRAEDREFIGEWCQDMGIDSRNSRVFKVNDSAYEV